MSDGVRSRLIHALRDHRAVRLAVLFGSRARGDARADSDVDLAVIAPGVDLLALAAALGLALDLDVEVIDLSTANIPLLEAVIADGVVVHEAERGAAAEWRSKALATLETDRPWFARMRDAYLRRVAARGFDHG